MQSTFFVRRLGVVRKIKAIVMVVVLAQLAGCVPLLGFWSLPTPGDNEETEETVETGIVIGTVMEPSVVDNDIAWTGAESVLVRLLDTDFSTYTLSDGSYMIDEVPVGSYEVYALASQGYTADHQPVIVLPDYISIVAELHATTDYRVIISGSVYENDKTTPLSGREIRAYSGTDTLRSEYFGSATTNSTGEFIIEANTSGRIYLLHNGVHIKFYSADFGYDTDFFQYNHEDTDVDGCAIISREGYLVE